jgi:hypothetical protein
MPTPYNPKTVLISPSSDRELCIELADLVEETVRFGSHVLEWWREEDSSNALEKLATFGMLRHTIELLDGMHDNIRHERFEANKGPLRFVLETYYSIKYLVRGDTSRRSRAYVFMHERGILEGFHKDHSSHPKHKEWQTAIYEDTILNPKGTPIMDDPGFDKFNELKIKQYEESLKDPQLKEVRKEFEQLSTKKDKNGKTKKPKHWYTLFGGPSSVQLLAKEVRGAGMYEQYYRRYSKRVHGEDLLQRSIQGGAHTGIYVVPLRSRQNRVSVFEVVDVPCQLAHEIFQSYVDKFIPSRSQEVRDWYQNEILNRHSEIKKKYSK